MWLKTRDGARPDILIQHIVHRKHRKYATNPDNFIQLDFLLERVRRQTRSEVADGRFHSLNPRPPDFHDNASDDDDMGFSNHTQVPEDNAQGFSSSQEVSDYLPQPYKGAAWDGLDDPGIDTDADAEKTADPADVRGAA